MESAGCVVSKRSSRFICSLQPRSKWVVRLKCVMRRKALEKLLKYEHQQQSKLKTYMTYLPICASLSLREFSHVIYICIGVVFLFFFLFSLTSHAADISDVSSSAVAMARMWRLL